MSGVEAAGFVLAVFPLLISALEHYRESAEVLKSWWGFKKEYKKCKQNINIQRLIFEENLEELLAPVIKDDDQLNLLLAEPGGTRWKDPDLEMRLKERLPKSYELYLGIIREIKDVMEELKQELGISKVCLQEKVACEEVRTSYAQNSSCAL